MALTVNDVSAEVGAAATPARSGRAARTARALAALAGIAWAFAASAAPECKFDQVRGGMVFTGYSPFGAGAHATFTLSYKCPNPIAAAWIGISSPRVLRAGGESLAFDVHAAPYPAPSWGDQPPVAVPPATSGTITVYGYLPPQDAAAGSYQATLSVTIYSHGPQNPTDTVSLAVSTSGFVDACTIGAGSLAFGSYDPVGANAASPLDAQASIEIACTRGTAWSVGLDPGGFPAGGARHLASGAARLRYELYSDPARTAAWTGTSAVSGTAPSTAPVPLPVYGRIPGGQPAAAGSYADVVRSTIDF